ncbi:MAG: hypothetical protein K2W91_09375 [Novosphingobium sp.]|nr:hypothetical protein [Novosphingobium sp.]
MFGRFGLVLACLGYSALALGSGLDRLSEKSPELASRVPTFFASEALRVRGGQALAAGQAQSALALGQAAIADAPTDPQSSALLGAGRLASGDRGGAEVAFRLAGKLGWRVPITQSYWMDRALGAGDYRIAAMRLDALLRQQPLLHRQRQLLDPLERNPAGRSALVERMAAGPVWLTSYAGDVHDLPADVMLQRVPVLSEAASKGLVLGCPAISPSVNRLAVLGLFREGSDLWRAHCPAAGTGLISDGQFSMATQGEKTSAFAWELLGSDGLTLGLELSPAGPGQRVTVQGAAPSIRPVLSQLLALRPGRYVVTWRSGDSQDRPSKALQPALACQGNAPQWLVPQPDQAKGRWRASVTVDGTCAAQMLQFGVGPDGGDLWLEEVRIEAAGP